MAITGHACDGWVFGGVGRANENPVSGTQQEVTNPPAEVTADVTENADPVEGNQATAEEQPETATTPAVNAEKGGTGGWVNTLVKK